MKEFQLSIIKVDIDHVNGSRHDDPRHGSVVGIPEKLATPQSLETCFNKCEITETEEGDLLVFLSEGYQLTLKKGDVLYVDSGLMFASNKGKYYKIAFQ